MRRISWIAALLALAAPAWAQVLNEGENLLVTIPPGFELAHRDGDEARAMEEFIPVGETLETWQEMITLQFFADLGGMSPAAFLGQMGGAFAEACPDGQIGPVNDLSVGAYPAALVVANCPNSLRTEGEESLVAYAIGGDRRLYVLQYAWARRPEQADFEAARAFFATALVCNTRRADAPCPGGG